MYSQTKADCGRRHRDLARGPCASRGIQTFCEVGRWLISGSGDGTLRVWDPDTGECEAVVQANEQPVSTLLAVDGGGLGNDKGLVSGSWDSSIAFWSLVEADQ